MTYLTKSTFLCDYWTKSDGIFAKMQIISYIFIILKHIQVSSQFRKLLMLKVWLSFWGDNLYKKYVNIFIYFLCLAYISLICKWKKLATSTYQTVIIWQLMYMYHMRLKGNQNPHIKLTFIIKYSLLRTSSKNLNKIRQRIRKLQLFEI